MLCVVMLNSKQGHLIAIKYINPCLLILFHFYYCTLYMHLNEFWASMEEHICVIMVR
jgi:hypothetical protein